MTQPEQPLFQDCKGGGRGQTTVHVSHAPAGILQVSMTSGVGPDQVGLVHALQRTDVVDLCKALSAWLESPESVKAAEPGP